MRERDAGQVERSAEYSITAPAPMKISANVADELRDRRLAGALQRPSSSVVARQPRAELAGEPSPPQQAARPAERRVVACLPWKSCWSRPTPRRASSWRLRCGASSARSGVELRFRAAANGELGIRAALRDRPEIIVADEIASRAGAFALAKALRDDTDPFTGA